MSRLNKKEETFPKVIRKITEVRSEYNSARLICTNLKHRMEGECYRRPQGYLPAEIDYTTSEGRTFSISVRDFDVRFLGRVASEKALDHLNLIHLARKGHPAAARVLRERMARLYPEISSRFEGVELLENDYSIPYTSSGRFSDSHISNKGAMLLDLTRQGFATPDFNLLTSRTYTLPAPAREKVAIDAIRNLEKLSGRKLGDQKNPLLIAMRSAMPEYIPGFMPTFLNVGLTPDLLPGLPGRYGREAAARIRLNNRKTILESLDPEAFHTFESRIKHNLSWENNVRLAERMEALIEFRQPRLLTSPHSQILFFLSKIYEYYENHLDVLRNFIGENQHYPTVIIQRMVCSVIDDQSYAGVLYSRHPRKGAGYYLQYARAVYGEDLMTGRLTPEEKHLLSPDEARHDFPAVFHFWKRLKRLEEIYTSPVMVEFTGVHGTFTLLQVNQAELSGVGMLTAVIDLHKNGTISGERVRRLIKPYHVRQIESDAIDPKSLQKLKPFSRGISVLPRSAVSGKLFFSGEGVKRARREGYSGNIILIKARFSPTDAIEMQKVDGICSLSPAAIHVVTTAQNLGIPALLNLEESGISFSESPRALVNSSGESIPEGSWVTISSRNKMLYAGRAVFAPARLLRFMAGEDIDLTAAETAYFRRIADSYREYKGILEGAEVSEFNSLKDLGHAALYGKLKDDPRAAGNFVNLCFDLNRDRLVKGLLEATLGTHLINIAAYKLLSPDRQINLLKGVLELSRKNSRSGYQAGAFVIGSLISAGLPAAFWESFAPDEIAILINEWVLHKKYQNLLSDVGERQTNRAKKIILTRGLQPLGIHPGLVLEFIPLKLSRVNLALVKESVPKDGAAETEAVIDLLQRPYSHFFDYSRKWSLNRLMKICDSAGLPLPGPNDR
jgi:hypothetical protein